MSDNETVHEVAVDGAEESSGPIRIVMGLGALAVAIAGVAVIAHFDPFYVEGNLNSVRVLFVCAAFVAAMLTAWHETSIKGRLSWAALLWVAWLVTFLLGPMVWLGASLAVASELSLMLALFAAVSRRRRVPPALSAALPRLRQQMTPEFPEAEWVHVQAKTRLRVDGTYRLEGERAVVTVCMTPPSVTVVTASDDTILLDPSAISAPKLTDALLQEAGIWQTGASWRVGSGEKLSLRGDIDWKGGAQPAGGYRERYEREPRRGVLAGPVELTIASAPRRFPHGQLLAAAGVLLGICATVIVARHHPFEIPEPDVAVLDRLPATLVKAEVNQEARTVRVEVAMDTTTSGTEDLYVSVNSASFHSARHKLAANVRSSNYNKGTLTVTVAFDQESPQPGQRYTLRIKVKAEKRRAGLLLARHRLTTVEVPVTLEPAGPTDPGDIACDDEHCNVRTDGDKVFARAKPGVSLRVAGQPIPADDAEHEVAFDVVSLFANKASSELTKVNTRRLPVSVRLPDGKELETRFDPGRELVDRHVTDVFWPVLTQEQGVQFPHDDDPEPGQPRMVLLFFDSQPVARTRGWYKLYGAGRGLKSVDLVASTERRFEEGPPCSYATAKTPRTVEHAVIVVVRRRTAEHVGQRAFVGTLPPCPATIPSTPVVDGGEVSEDAVARFLASFLE